MAKSNRIWAVAALFLMVTGFTACLKSDTTTPSRPVAAFALIQGITASATVDFYDNSTIVTKDLKLGFGGISYKAYGGVHVFELRKSGGTTAIASTTNVYDSLAYYTLISYGDSTSPVLRSFKDDFSTASNSALNYRFFNLSPYSGPVDLYLNSTKIDSNVNYVATAGLPTTFKANTSITYVNSITVKKAGKDSVIVTNSSLSMSTGNVYTIYFTGINNGTGNLAPKVNIIPSYY